MSAKDLTDAAAAAATTAAGEGSVGVEGASAAHPELLVKLCGMRTEADVAGALAAGCDFVGFVVEVPGKRRSVSRAQLSALTATLPSEARAVGVFVDAPVEAVHRLLAEGIIDAAQLHGSEDDIYIARLRQLLAEDGAGEAEPPSAKPAQRATSATTQPSQPAPPARSAPTAPEPPTRLAPCDPHEARIIQAFRIRGHDDIAAAAASTADLVLLDSGAGSGKPFDWQLLEGFPRPFLLAGGLGPDNLAQAIAQAQRAAGANFAGVDMSSGIETDNVKDPLKMKAATAAAKGANR